MDRYIGLDAHASSRTLGVFGPGGKRFQGQAQRPWIEVDVLDVR